MPSLSQLEFIQNTIQSARRDVNVAVPALANRSDTNQQADPSTVPKKCKHCKLPYGEHSADSLDCNCKSDSDICRHHHSVFCRPESAYITNNKHRFHLVKEAHELGQQMQKCIDKHTEIVQQKLKIGADQLVDKTQDDVECFVCMCIVVDPVFTTCCTQIICSDCLVAAVAVTGKCPHCRAENSEYKECDAVFLRRLNNRMVKCNTPDCNQICHYDALPRHQASVCLRSELETCHWCHFTNLSADVDVNPHQRCGVIGNHAGHVNGTYSCTNQVECPFCKHIKTRKFAPDELITHINRCPYVSVSCSDCQGDELISRHHPQAMQLALIESHDQEYQNRHRAAYRVKINELVQSVRKLKATSHKNNKSNLDLKNELDTVHTDLQLTQQLRRTQDIKIRQLEDKVQIRDTLIEQIAKLHPHVQKDVRLTHLFPNNKRSHLQAFGDA